jgi:DNA-binding SARP family transcriptional activator
MAVPKKKTSEKQLEIHMLGEFSIRYGDAILTDEVSHVKKVWMLIEYLLVNRASSVPQEKLIDELWADEESDNPLGALKNLVYRARTELKKLDADMGAGLIQYTTNAYAWNNEVPVWIDAEAFEALAQQAAAATDQDEKTALYLQATELYGGPFLPKSAYAEWVVFRSTHYAGLYSDCVHHAAEGLTEQDRREELLALCERAVALDPFDECAHRYLIQAYADVGRNDRALAHYQDVSDLFYKEFGVNLSEETRQQHKRLTEEFQQMETDLSVIRNQLEETQINRKGAYYCADYEVFQNIYRVQARMLERTGLSIHLAMITALDRMGQPPAARILQQLMPTMIDVVTRGLRQGDVVWRFSRSQLVMMLPMTTYEDCVTVVSRLLKNFRESTRFMAIDLRMTVCAMEPVGESGKNQSK